MKSIEPEEYLRLKQLEPDLACTLVKSLSIVEKEIALVVLHENPSPSRTAALLALRKNLTSEIYFWDANMHIALVYASTTNRTLKVRSKLARIYPNLDFTIVKSHGTSTIYASPKTYSNDR